MSYQSLARKYRPLRFEDLVGQDAVTKALSNAIQIKRIPQGVLFAGVRGVGKTTTARLFAKALNCIHGPTDEPCNVCESCLAINSGTHEDVLEIDGASHTGIEDVRELQETLDYVPQRSTYKVYIIDEVHMLSQSAFNALLKSIEEPPEHVVFAFATTELQKVPETILSRCQIFRLQHIPLETMIERLSEVLKKEQVQFEEKALVEIAKVGRGSMRDALTFLDQVVALGEGLVSSEIVNTLTNAADTGSYIRFIEGMLAKDAAKLLAEVDNWQKQGVNFKSLAEELAKLSRHSFIVKELGTSALDVAVLGLSPGEIDALGELAETAGLLELNQIFRILVRSAAELDGSELDRYMFENNILEWCLDPGFPDMSDLSQLLTEGRPATPKSSFSASDRKPSQTAPSQQGNVASSSGKSSLKTLTERLELQKNSPSDAKKKLEPAQSDDKLNREIENSGTEASKNETQAATDTPSASKNSLEALQNRLKKVSGTISSEPEQKPREEPAQSIKGSSEREKTVPWPQTWKAMVEYFMENRALIGRKLQDSIPVSYGRELIHVQVASDSLGSKYLLSPDSRSEFVKSLRSIFKFTGELRVASIEEAGNDETKQDKTILAVHKEEKLQKKQAIEKELKEHPLTQEAIKLFNAKIKTIEFTDQP